jgi:hypothetical protein
MTLRGSSTAVHTLPSSPASMMPWKSNSGAPRGASALSPRRVSDSGAGQKQDGSSRQLMTTHRQLRAQQQQQQATAGAFFTLDGDEPRRSLSTPEEGEAAYDPQQLFDDPAELRPEAVLQLHDSSSSLASLPAHLVASPVPSGQLPSKPLMVLHPAEEEGPTPQKPPAQQASPQPAPRQLPSTTASPMSRLWSPRQRDQDERPSGPLAMLRDRWGGRCARECACASGAAPAPAPQPMPSRHARRGSLTASCPPPCRSSQVLRKLKGIMPDFARARWPAQQQQQQQQLASTEEAEEQQEPAEAEAAGSEGSGRFRAWSPSNTLFGDKGLGTVPMEAPTASLQVGACC